MAYTPSKWGGSNTSADYVALMEGDLPRAKPIVLEDHGLTAFNQELRDPLDVTVSEVRRGRVVFKSKRLRQAEEIAKTFTILFGADGPLYTPALQRAREGAGCPTDFYAKRLCLEKDDYEHAYIWPESIMNPPTRVEDFITIGDTTPTVANQQSEVRAPEELILWGVGAFEQVDVGGTIGLYAVAFLSEDCVGCQVGTVPMSRIIAVGGDGTAAGSILLSDDRFATNTSLTSLIPAGSVGTSVFTEGNVALVGFADDPDVAAGATGGTVITSGINDDTPSFTIDSNITASIYGVGRFSGVYLAVGGAAAGAMLVYESVDGIDWDAVVSAALPATAAATAVAVDEDAGAFYVTGESGNLLKGSGSPGAFIITDIKANLPGTPGALNSVAVLGMDHIMVVGAAGYAAESYDGGETFRAVASGSSASAYAVSGTRFRTLIGNAGPQIRIADVLTDYAFENKVPELGSTLGTAVRGIASDMDDINHFVAVTADGEVVYIKGFYPNA